MSTTTFADPGKNRNRRASLHGCRCPYCRRALLRFDRLTRINTCPGCQGQVVTEEEWQRRLNDRPTPAEGMTCTTG